MEPWLTILQTFGVAVTCLAALGFAVWRTAKWMGANFLVPVRDAHIKFLEKLENGLQSLMTDQKTQSHNIEHMVEDIKTIAQGILDVQKKVDKVIVRSDTVTINPPGRGENDNAGPNPPR